jgi:KDO2-lipid IV(A) lauroyltransferase
MIGPNAFCASTCQQKPSLIPSAPVIRAATRLLRVTPVPVARALAAAGGMLGWAIQSDRRRTLLQNLSFTAPDRSEAERRRMARRTFRNLAVTAVDLFRLPNISPAEVRSLFEIRGLQHVDAALARGKGIVVATAHLGPYELAAACLAANGYSVYGMVENLEPEVLDALASYRSATGMQLVNMKDGLRSAIRILGEKNVLCLVADRAVGDTRGTIEVPFAGGRRLLPTGPAVFAQATGAALITAFASPNPRGKPRYVMEFDPPIFAEGRGEEERTRLMNHVVERMSAAVRRNPDQWFVFQPNWIERESA